MIATMLAFAAFAPTVAPDDRTAARLAGVSSFRGKRPESWRECRS